MRVWRTGDISRGRVVNPPTCTAKDCENPVHAKGVCQKHRYRLRVHGDLDVQLPADLTPEQRYEKNIDRSAGPDACHPWTAGTTEDGYGYLKADGKMTGAHRFGWRIANGTDPGKMKVCHTCDNPPCQNKTHWFLGTSGDNSADRDAKSRQASGERNAGAKLSRAQVKEIRDRLSGQWGEQTALAGEYSVAQETISAIARGKTWKGV